MGRVSGFPRLEIPLCGPDKEDYRVSRSILGSPYLGKLPHKPMEEGE